MSIQSLNSGSDMFAAEEGHALTGLIASLASSVFHGTGPCSGSAPAEALRPHAATTEPNLPVEFPFQQVSPFAPVQAAPGAQNGGLSGGFPSTSTSQPVHPVVDAAPSSPSVGSRTGPQLTSGEHHPDSLESHPFGEPASAEQLRSHRSGFSTAPDLAGHAGEPEFYFLREPQRQGHAAAAGLSGFEIEAIRRDFPALHQRVNGHPLVYLDNAATTHKPQRVLDATSVFYGRDNANIHRAAHALSERATHAFEAGREKVRRFLGAADKREIVFVRGTTEGINLVAQSYGRKNIGAGDEIILTQLEHHANIVPWQLLAEQVGATLRVIPINERGELLLEEFVKLLGPKTKFVSIGHVSNALGTINPVQEVIALAHAHGVPVLIDGAQSTPHLPVNVTELDADFYVFSGHKVFGPTGIGALYGKAHLLEAMPPYQGGGHMIEDVRFEKTVYRHAPEKFEAGTPDIAGVVGLGAAIDYLFDIGIPALAAYEHALLEYATEAIQSVRGLRLIGTAREKASVFSFLIDGVPNDKIAAHLDRRGIAVRAGHHCAMPSQRHFGVESTVRPSLAFYNTHAEVDALVAALHALPRH